jgi:hypothetical protein
VDGGMVAMCDVRRDLRQRGSSADGVRSQPCLGVAQPLAPLKQLWHGGMGPRSLATAVPPAAAPPQGPSERVSTDRQTGR